jgi:6-phosphogluconolactonase
MPEEFFYTDRAALQANLQDALCTQLRHSLEKFPRATLFVSGGSTPAPLYQSLASATLPWERLNVALVDERWVPESDEASNARMLRETLLCGPAAACQFTGMKVAHELQGESEAVAVKACNLAYKQLPQPWSAAVLGMGADGHTASLFPHAERLQEILEAKTLCAAVHAPAGGVASAHTARMTLTPYALLKCERLFLLITGRDKRLVYEKARVTKDHASLPVSVFLQQAAVPLTVFWSP